MTRGFTGRYDGRRTGDTIPGPTAAPVRLKVRPSRAEVFVDGYYVGIVDEFDNPFQQLPLESGPHRSKCSETGTSR